MMLELIEPEEKWPVSIKRMAARYNTWAREANEAQKQANTLKGVAYRYAKQFNRTAAQQGFARCKIKENDDE